MSGRAKRLRLQPIGLREANAFIAAVQDDHRPIRRYKFALAAQDDDGLVRGVAIAGRPVSRVLDTGWRLEILRVATDDTPNACSFLYAAVARAGTAVGYRRQDILTYTPASEPGTSLRAAGWVPVATTTTGATWDRPTRPRTDKHPTTDKVRWHAAPPTPPPPSAAGSRP